MGLKRDPKPADQRVKETKAALKAVRAQKQAAQQQQNGQGGKK